MVVILSEATAVNGVFFFFLCRVVLVFHMVQERTKLSVCTESTQSLCEIACKTELFGWFSSNLFERQKTKFHNILTQCILIYFKSWAQNLKLALTTALCSQENYRICNFFKFLYFPDNRPVVAMWIMTLLAAKGAKEVVTFVCWLFQEFVFVTVDHGLCSGSESVSGYFNNKGDLF